MNLDLFGEPVDIAKNFTPYRVVGRLDLDSPPCAECRHVRWFTGPPPKKGKADVKWECKINHIEVDPDDGTCGQFVPEAIRMEI